MASSQRVHLHHFVAPIHSPSILRQVRARLYSIQNDHSLQAVASALNISSYGEIAVLLTIRNTFTLQHQITANTSMTPSATAIQAFCLKILAGRI